MSDALDADTNQCAHGAVSAPTHSEQSSYVRLYRRMIAMTDHYLDKNSTILDFGCGAGSFVYQFRDAGFQACGFDIHDYLELRKPEDRRWFQIAQTDSTDKSIMSLDWSSYRLPYPDATFDFILSNQTLEHVLDLHVVLRELARVMKPGGIAIHIFQSRYRYLEAHTYVPFGGMTKSYWYNFFWAMCGIRNEFQRGYGVRETAQRNTRYARTGTNYPPVLELRRAAQKHYGHVRFAPELWHAAWGCFGLCTTRLARVRYTLFNQVVLVLEQPKP